MARLRKCRRVCCMPSILRFTPDCQKAEFLTLSVDELESLRLCDLEGLEQDEAAAVMAKASTASPKKSTSILR